MLRVYMNCNKEEDYNTLKNLIKADQFYQKSYGGGLIDYILTFTPDIFKPVLKL